MKLPKHFHPDVDYGISMTEPGQAISLQTIAYRVSIGQTTGLASIPQEYGDDGDDDPDYNGMEAERLDAQSAIIDFREEQEELKKRASIKKRSQPEKQSPHVENDAPSQSSE